MWTLPPYLLAVCVVDLWFRDHVFHGAASHAFSKIVWMLGPGPCPATKLVSARRAHLFPVELFVNLKNPWLLLVN